jgi:hypothetical protein
LLSFKWNWIERPMRTDSGVQREPLSAWIAENLRLTAFASGQSDISTAKWVEDLFGEDVVRLQDNRASGIRTEIVPFAKGRLLLQRIPAVGVVHWTYAIPQDLPTVPLESTFVETLEEFRDVVERWFQYCPDLHRMAFGCILRLPVPSREAGYRKMSNYMVFDLDDESVDFSYQINRPRLFTGGSAQKGGPIRINRLARWSVGATFAVSIPPVQMVPNLMSSFCRVELDINTAPETDVILRRASLHSIFGEMVSLSSELVTEGDIK